MMAMKIPTKLAFALALAMVVLLSGCASNKFVPCCTKDSLYNTATDPPTFLPGSNCIFPNGTAFGACQASPDPAQKGVVECADASGSSCGSLSEQECGLTSTCRWDSGACTGGPAKWVMPVCVDSAPKSCVNNRCTAMMCGYAPAVSGPPLSSQDWNASSPSGAADSMPQNELSALPRINLQGTQCKFEKMTLKLYNKVTKAKGSLWVNSFRFGVGRSFSDYEQSKYFFPASDKICGINPKGSVDRFTVYLNEPGTWCGQTSSYYTCSQNSMNFTSRSTCLMFCGNNAADCNAASSPVQYKCVGDGFAYSNQTICKQNCDIIENPGLCTTSAATSPYLLPDTRYKAKYVSDYLVDSWRVSADDDQAYKETCLFKGGSQGAIEFSEDEGSLVDGWDPEYHQYCDDYYPAGGNRVEYAIPEDGPWWWWKPATNELRTYFENRKSPSIDFDYEYYSTALRQQYQSRGYNFDQILPFECSSGLECISGSCDTTYYKRGLCKTTSGGTVGCDCRKDRTGQQMRPALTCFEQTNVPVFAETSQSINGHHLVQSVTDLYFDQATEYSRGNYDVNFRYYVPVGGDRPKLFEKCNRPPTGVVTKCIYGDAEFDGMRFTNFGMVISDPTNGNPPCPPLVEGNTNNALPADYNYYDITFDNGVGNHLGNCTLDNPLEAPYLDTTTLGWCAGCTLATLAVQDITWSGYPGGVGTSGGLGSLKSLACYEWRGEMDYSVPSSPLGAGRDSSTLLRASVSDVRKYAGGNPYNGNIERESFDSPLIGSDSAVFSCNDQWRGNAWWYQQGVESRVPYPSAPILRDKLTSYLQSNIMPILDERSSHTAIKYEFRMGVGGWFGSFAIVPTGTLYDPMQVCNNYGGDGAAIHVIGDTGLLTAASSPDNAYINATTNPGLSNYLALSGAILGLSGKNALLIRADKLTSDCRTRPLIGLAINSGEDLSSLVGNPPGTGKLHSFMYTNREAQYDWRVANGVPDKYPGKIDVFLQEWYPTCSASAVGTCSASGIAGSCSEQPMYYCRPGDGTLQGPYEGTCSGGVCSPADSDSCLQAIAPYHRCTAPDSGYDNQLFSSSAECSRLCPHQTFTCSLDGAGYPTQPACLSACTGGSNEVQEIQNRIAFSRALLSNFSRPSLIWKFHFPTGSSCNKDRFLEYLFNHTGDLVDAGITGLVYDAWMTQDGRGYGNPSETVVSNTGNVDETIALYTGLTNVLADGRLDDPSAGKSSSAFCALQKNSKAVLGVTKYTYGQRIYALGNESCTCSKCTESDYAFGQCARNPAESGPQHDCNDGSACIMPAAGNYDEYRCPGTCVYSEACQLCNSSTFSGASSFCRMEQVGEPPVGYTKPYSDISDTYWEFVAGLPAKNKCCLLKEIPDQPPLEYTYVKRTGQKSRSEFLQYPTRGEPNIDCGRTPDTSILKYCNIPIPIEQKDITCYRT